MEMIGVKLNSKYQVKSELGKGGFGTVYKCCVLNSKTYVAIKVFQNRHRNNKNRKYAKREIKIFEDMDESVKELPMSNYLISMLDHFSNDQITCIVFPLYGPNIKKVLKQKGSPFKLEEVRTIADQLIKATRFLHDRNMLHTDIKPENILLNDEPNFAGSYKMPDITLCDLGTVITEQKFGCQVITTLPYRAPDVVMGHKIGYPCDVWSIGCTIFQLITGKQLFIVSKIEELLVLIDETLDSFTVKQMKYITSDNNNPIIKLPSPEDKYDPLLSNV